MAEWTRGPKGNLILECDEFFISYQADTSTLHSPADMVIASILGVNNEFTGDYGGCDETALCANDGTYFVLNGDFREQFAEVFDDGFSACFALYQQLAVDHRSSWSDDAD